MLKIKICLYSLLHVSAHPDLPQGAYAEPCQSYTFVELISKKHIVISVTMLWQHVFQAVVCVLNAVQRATESAAYTEA